MLKLMKNWKFIFLFTLLLLYLTYFGVVYENELELPSENWSRNLSLTEFKVDSISNTMSNNNIFSLPLIDKNAFLTLWFENNTINYLETNDIGVVTLKGTLDLNTKSVRKIRGILKGDIIALYILENKELKEYELNANTKEIISNKIIATQIKDFIVENDLFMYSDDNSFNLIDSSGKIETIENIKAERYEVTKDLNNELYHIVLYEKTNIGDKFLNYLTYNLKSNNLTRHKLTSLGNSTKMSLNRVDIGLINDTINILASVTDNRFAVNTLHHFKFSPDDPSSFSKNTLNIDSLTNSLIPSPQILKNEKNSLTFIASGNIIKGKDTETINLIKYTLDDKGNLVDQKLLTKTNSTSLNPYYFTLNGHNYLVSTDINGKDKQILLSSDNGDVINASKKLTGREMTDLFMATFTSLVPTAFISLISVMNIFVPIILFIFIVSVVNLRLIENYSTKMFIIILVLHSALKASFSTRYILSNSEVYNFLPSFLKNPLSLYFLLALGTLIALYCLKMFLESSKHRRHLIKSYSFFAFIDLAIFTFLTTPYIYSYLLFTYKINLS
ncbi:hypothetical protein R9X47_16210 [Wukongibacter baidiensis]|uniref:hypothetical protein n=1 Tax=Wukongibacter baidiensis TaxID=1723361 RepID=UPI003D7FE2DE